LICPVHLLGLGAEGLIGKKGRRSVNEDKEKKNEKKKKI
jgi:hypothetical protein